MEMCYARRILLDFGKGCPYHRIQATGKTDETITRFYFCEIMNLHKKDLQMFNLRYKYYL